MLKHLQNSNLVSSYQYLPIYHQIESQFDHGNVTTKFKFDLKANHSSIIVQQLQNSNLISNMGKYLQNMGKYLQNMGKYLQKFL